MGWMWVMVVHHSLLHRSSAGSTIGQLQHLTQLQLVDCKTLKELPQSIGNLSSLSMLDLSHCKSIESLPTTIGQLQHLT
jgi:Leucine-rich repeat (LRR) protein